MEGFKKLFRRTEDKDGYSRAPLMASILAGLSDALIMPVTGKDPNYLGNIRQIDDDIYARKVEAQKAEQDRLRAEYDQTLKLNQLGQQGEKMMRDAGAESADRELRKRQLDIDEMYKKGVISNQRNEILRSNIKDLEDYDTIYGLARTKDDAKKLKDATELKEAFDSKLSEMIQLREKHGGGEIWNREDVSRGKQLATDTLLLYKDLAKLGVLSKSDERLLNKVIPEDPLAYSFVPGQDPILSNLKKFKGSAEQDFQTRLNTRLRNPSSAKIPAPPLTKLGKDGKTYKKVEGGWEQVD